MNEREVKEPASKHVACTVAGMRELIDGMLVEELAPRKARQLREHLGACPSCQERYNRVVLASRLLAGGPKAIAIPSEGELQRVRARVLERVRLVPDAEPARRQSIFRWVAVLAASAAVFALVLPLALHFARPPATGRGAGGGGGVAETAAELGGRPEFEPRGPAQASPTEKLGLRAFCIQSAAAGATPVVQSVLPTDPAAPAAKLTSCGLGDVLKFAYTNRSELPYLFLVGLDERYAVKWYEPHPPRTTSVEVKKDAVNQTIPRAVKIGVNHEAGALRLYAIFSAQPVEARQIEAAAAAAKKAKIPLARLTALTLEGVGAAPRGIGVGAPRSGRDQAVEQRSLLLKLSAP